MASRTIDIEEAITVGELAERLMIPVSQLIGELMKNGVMATVNERIDFDTAQIIVGELELDIELAKKAKEKQKPLREKRTSDKGELRPPVVAVMGHVDHGKTTLLDAIRGAKVASGEAGGITQHISVYQIEHDKRKITFLDTPGHEAFAALREHGAQLTDLAIIVVAADDGIKPQTIEAIRFARKANVKIIVAINKIDKPEADIPRLKQQLSEQNLLVEEWGGDTVVVEVSAKTGQGTKELLDMVLLVADVEELKAETNMPGEGLIIESHMEQGRGPVAVALVEQGKVKKGDTLVAGDTYAKLRSLETTDNKPLDVAGPSTPVIIVGFKALPNFGEEFKVVENEKVARQMTQKAGLSSQKHNINTGIGSGELIRIIDRANQVSELNVIVKADVQGSLTSVVDALKSLDTKEVAVKFVATGVGTPSENDVHLASSSKAIIYCFNVTGASNIKQLANRDKVPVREFKVIYELIDDVKEELSSLLIPEIVETELGILKVKAVFKTTKTDLICGGEVTKGKLALPARAKVFRDKELIAEAEVAGLKIGPQEVKEVNTGELCGIQLKTTAKVNVAENDRIEFFTRESVQRSL